MPIQQIFLGSGAGSSTGWVLMTNYLTSTPSTHTTIHRSGKGLVQSSTGKYYALEQFGENLEPRVLQVLEFDEDGDNVAFKKGWYKSGASDSTLKHVFASGFNMDSSNNIWLFGRGFDSTKTNGTRNWGWVEKYNPATNTVLWQNWAQQATNKASWNTSGYNPSSQVTLWHNEQRAEICGGQVGGSSDHMSITVSDVYSNGSNANGDWSAFGTFDATGGNRLNVSWGAFCSWGVQTGSSISSKRLYLAGRWNPPNYQFGSSVGIFDDVPGNEYYRSDAYSSSGSGNRAVYIGDLISNSAGTTAWAVVRPNVTDANGNTNVRRPEVVKITDASGNYNGSLNFTVYQIVNDIRWSGSTSLAVDSSGNVYCQSHINLPVTNPHNGESWNTSCAALIKFNTSGNIEWIYRVSRPNNYADGPGSGVGLIGTRPNLEVKVMINNNDDPVLFGYNSWSNQPGESIDGVDRANWTTPVYIMIPKDGKLESGTYGTGQGQWTITNLEGSFTASSQTNYWTSHGTCSSGSQSFSESSGSNTNSKTYSVPTTNTTVTG